MLRQVLQCWGKQSCPLTDYCITLVEGEITAEAGLCVVIPCSFTVPENIKVLHIVWLKCESTKQRCGYGDMIFNSNTFSDQVQSEFKGRVSLLESDVSKKNCSIIVNDLKESDSGTYQLRVEASPRRGSYKFSQRATVSVQGLSQRPTVMIPPLTEGQLTTLTCTAPGLCSGSEPTFTWRWRGGGESDADLTGNITAFKTENVAEFAKRRSSTLSFSPSAEHHGTNITCRILFQGNVSTEETATLSVSFVHTHITESSEKQELDGRSSVMLSCFSHSFPPVQHYSWYRKSQGEEKDELVSEHQNHTVYSNQSGVYYCVAQNEVNQSLSDPVHLFEPTGNSLHILKFIVPALFVLMIIILIIIVLRLRRKKSIQQGTTNIKSPSGFSEQLSRPDAPEHQPLPDSTPPTDINLVYSILNLPQAASAQNHTRRQAGNTEEDSVNYAPLNFKNNLKKKQRKVEEDSVYAKVSKPTRVKKKEPEILQDYENISDAAARAPTSPNLFDDHTSEGEVELNFPQVRFTATPRRQTTNRDSSSSHQDESLYSNVRNV